MTDTTNRCPFCGGDDLRMHAHGGIWWYSRCRACEARGPHKDTKAAALAAFCSPPALQHAEALARALRDTIAQWDMVNEQTFADQQVHNDAAAALSAYDAWKGGE